MKVSLKWLREWVDLPQELTSDEIAHKLTFAGTEVEEIVEVGKDLNGVVVGFVKERKQHPNADRLSLCRVQTAEGDFPVVCGAANVKQNQYIAFAPTGTVLPNGLKLKKSKIRGEVSEGMICSESELGLAEESEGILELPADVVVGDPIAKALGIEDVIFELAITPNRADLLGHIGVARELAAILDLPFKTPAKVSAMSESQDSGLEIDIKDKTLCPAYFARKINQIQIVPSPDWVQKRLLSIGLRPINQVVDATNYVLMETGHPTHAFDARMIEGQKIVIRRAKEGENFTTLDGGEHQLSENDLMIADPRKSVALAGVMGGANSEIREDTQDIILECAYFIPKTVRFTARRLGISSDSSYRFERGTDPNAIERVMDRLTQLILLWTEERTGSKPEVSSVFAEKGELPKNKSVSISTEEINRRLGTQLKGSEVHNLLKRLQLKLTPDSNTGLQTWDIPSFRVDLSRPIDLVEEVARLYGYDQIPVSPPRPQIQVVPRNSIYQGMRALGPVLQGHGFSEARNYSFVSGDENLKLGWSDEHPCLKPVAIRNPISEEQSVMRTSLLGGLLRNVSYNLNRGRDRVALYEIGKVYFPAAEDSEDFVSETWRIGGIGSGRRSSLNWHDADTETFDFFDMKGVLENMAVMFPQARLTFQPSQAEEVPFLHPKQSAEVWLQGRSPKDQVKLGWLGVVHPRVAQEHGISMNVVAFELDFEVLVGAQLKKPEFKAISTYPESRRDLAILVDQSTPEGDIADAIQSVKGTLIESAQLFDVYQGKQVPEGKKSLAYALHYGSLDRTLKSQEIDKAHEKVLKVLRKNFSAEIRS